MNLLAVIPLILSCFAAFVGILAILSPVKFVSFYYSYAGFQRFSDPLPQTSSLSGLRKLEIRLMGILLTAGAGLFVWLSVLAILSAEPSQVSTGESAPIRPLPHDWFSFALGLAVLLGGASLVAKPMAAIDFYLRKMLPIPRTPRPDAIPRMKLMVRIMGLVAIIASITAFRAWLRSISP